MDAGGGWRAALFCVCSSSSGLITQPYHPSAVFRPSITFHSSARCSLLRLITGYLGEIKRKTGRGRNSGWKKGDEARKEESRPLRKRRKLARKGPVRHTTFHFRPGKHVNFLKGPLRSLRHDESGRWFETKVERTSVRNLGKILLVLNPFDCSIE